jgi:hypothetical protein
MRIADQISHISQAYGARSACIAAALLAMLDARTGLVTVAVWAIAERAGCGPVQARRLLHQLAGAGIIEIDENQQADMMQEANTYRWIGVGAYEQARIKQWRLAQRARARTKRLHDNERKRAQKAERLEAMIARRIGKGIREGIQLYWQRHDDTLLQGFAPRIDERALQETPYIYKKKSSLDAVSEARLRMEERRRRR